MKEHLINWEYTGHEEIQSIAMPVCHQQGVPLARGRLPRWRDPGMAPRDVLCMERGAREALRIGVLNRPSGSMQSGDAAGV